ncbi:hypothetical protein FQN60_002157 [Etheostoma spectabile]|uniref:Mitochondrial carrier homolog 1 n=1 Tax=Etheostoma spectabile TaxID=54343 RepID=A0A5J5DC01_9PERO|nr:hypothetical protein FQN60_002157 [Etheostoma spectabile]
MESSENLSGQEAGVEQDATPTLVDVDAALLLLGAGVTAITHPLLYVKLLIQPVSPVFMRAKETSCWGVVLPVYVMSVRCMAQFVGREVKYGGLVPHVAGEVLFLWFCNLLAHFINTYAVDDSFTQASAVRSYTKFVMGIAVSALTYPFMLVADIMAVNNCGLAAGLPPRSPIFESWLHCWNHLSHKVPPIKPSPLLTCGALRVSGSPSAH